MITKIPILNFHSIDNDGSVLSFPPAKFDKVVNKIARKGFTTISLFDVVDWINRKITFSSPVIAITFDDGFENLYSHAFPILEEFGFQATIFLTTGYCGSKNNWPSQPKNIPTKSILGWGQLREMSKSIFDIQAHSINHPYLSREPSEVIKEEIVGSKKKIEDKIGKPVNFFAYPYGDYSQEVMQRVRQMFSGACSVKMGFANKQSDHFLLERIEMYYFSLHPFYYLFLSAFFAPFAKSISVMRRLKYKNNIIL